METPIYDSLTDIYILEDFDWDVPCDCTAYHEKHEYGHDGPAAFLMSIPCGSNPFMCAGGAATIRECGGCYCACGGKHKIDTINFIPLDVTP